MFKLPLRPFNHIANSKLWQVTLFELADIDQSEKYKYSIRTRVLLLVILQINDFLHMVVFHHSLYEENQERKQLSLTSTSSTLASKSRRIAFLYVVYTHHWAIPGKKEALLWGSPTHFVRRPIVHKKSVTTHDVLEVRSQLETNQNAGFLAQRKQR